MVKPDTLSDLRRRLRNARSRALYWSGNPTFSGNRFRPGRTRALGGHDFQYEQALDDIDSLSRLIEEATGRPVKRSDPKRAYNAAFLAARRP